MTNWPHDPRQPQPRHAWPLTYADIRKEQEKDTRETEELEARRAHDERLADAARRLKEAERILARFKERPPAMVPAPAASDDDLDDPFRSK